MERFFDILISTFTLIAISPLFVPIVIILKFTGEGEIFFFQERVGKDGVVFKLIKFATMLKDSPNIGTGTVTVSADPRVLPFGKILRKTKINELPQLLNIFFGNMSLIGPRPLTLQTFEAYSPRIQEVVKKVILPLWNTYYFFTTYSNIDNFEPKGLPDNLDNNLDKWLMTSMFKY